jgi:hypothetical protein
MKERCDVLRDSRQPDRFQFSLLANRRPFLSAKTFALQKAYLFAPPKASCGKKTSALWIRNRRAKFPVISTVILAENAR